MRANEQSWRGEAEVDAGLDRIWDAMKARVQRGLRTEGCLPGKLRVKRRAAELHRALSTRPEQALRDQLTILDFVNVYAMAVNEVGSRTGAPTHPSYSCTTFPAPSSSNVTCGFPALRSPACFMPRVM